MDSLAAIFSLRIINAVCHHFVLRHEKPILSKLFHFPFYNLQFEVSHDMNKCRSYRPTKKP